MPIVVNIKTYTPKQKDIYIGRSGRYPSPLANPYTHIQSGRTRAEHVVATREESIECYRAWLQEKIAKRDPAVMYELQRITAQTQLVCHCKPLSCHGDVIIEEWRKYIARGD